MLFVKKSFLRYTINIRYFFMPKATVKHGPWETKYEGIIFSIKQRDVIFPDGSTKRFEYSFRPHSVVIMPFDAKGRLLLINEFRHGVNRYTYFLPAGRIDGDEKPLVAAKRELREETGMGAKKWKFLRKRFANSNTVWESHIYLAKDLYPSAARGDEDFPITVKAFSMRQAVKMALDGSIANEFIAYNILYLDYLMKTKKFKW